MALVRGGGGAKPVVVNKRSQDFQRVHYMLEMALIHADVKITHIQMWDIGSPAQVAKFEGVSKKMRGQPALDTWIDMEGMDSINSEENVFRRGKSLSLCHVPYLPPTVRGDSSVV